MGFYGYPFFRKKTVLLPDYYCRIPGDNIGRGAAFDASHRSQGMVTLRKKLEVGPDAPRFIQTHVGIGYRMLKVE